MQTAKLFNFTPTFLPSSIIKKSQTYCTNNKPFQITNFPKICITNDKSFQISSCMKDAGPNSGLKASPVLKDVSNSILTIEKKLQLYVSSAFEAIFSAVKEKSSLALAKSFVIENDLIKFEHNGREIVGVVRDVVHHVGDLMETTLQCEHGLEKFKISIFDVVNVTYRYYEGKERMWGIHTTVECKDGDVEKMVEEIKDILNAHDDVKCNSKLVMMDSLCPKNNKIIVMSFVTCSKLRSPPYVHYMEVRRKVLSEIDEIQRKHEVRRKVLLEIEEVLSK